MKFKIELSMDKAFMHEVHLLNHTLIHMEDIMSAIADTLTNFVAQIDTESNRIATLLQSYLDKLANESITVEQANAILQPAIAELQSLGATP